jgi:hypothetical protein
VETGCSEPGIKLDLGGFKAGFKIRVLSGSAESAAVPKIKEMFVL